MAYTSHGHYIWGTIIDKKRPSSVVRCGGPKICSVCAKEFDEVIQKKKKRKRLKKRNKSTL